MPGNVSFASTTFTPCQASSNPSSAEANAETCTGSLPPIVNVRRKQQSPIVIESASASPHIHFVLNSDGRPNGLPGSDVSRNWSNGSIQSDVSSCGDDQSNRRRLDTGFGPNPSHGRTLARRSTLRGPSPDTVTTCPACPEPGGGMRTSWISSMLNANRTRPPSVQRTNLPPVNSFTCG